MRRLLLLLLPSLFHTTTLVSPFALADATAEVGECVNDEDGTCASDDNHGQDEKLCTIYLQDEQTNIDGTTDENASSAETNGEGNDDKHSNNNNDDDNNNNNNNNNNKHKYKTIHCSEKEIAYLLEMDAKSISERDRELATLETIVKTAMEANEQHQNDAASETESLWSAMQYNILKQLQDIANKSTNNNTDNGTDDIRYGPNGDRLISPSLLSTKVGKGGAVPVTNPIWLAVMGRVYDVTAGEGFYKFGGGGYSLFAGRDASPCFATGNFTVAGAEEPIGDLDGKALAAILEWMEFYEKSDKYEYVGVLAGGIFYDEEGRETEVGRSIREKATKAKEEADRVKEEKKREREKRRAERMKNKKNKK